MRKFLDHLYRVNSHNKPHDFFLIFKDNIHILLGII